MWAAMRSRKPGADAAAHDVSVGSDDGSYPLESDQSRSGIHIPPCPAFGANKEAESDENPEGNREKSLHECLSLNRRPLERTEAAGGAGMKTAEYKQFRERHRPTEIVASTGPLLPK
jgi:hypothetical protein